MPKRELRRTRRSSILARLLVGSLVVLGCSIVATAMITTQSTTEQLEGELNRSVADDDEVYRQLLAYAETHPNWNDVQTLVASLGDADRRITLTTPDGVPIADSAPPETRAPLAAGSSARRIDALSVAVQAAAQIALTDPALADPAGSDPALSDPGRAADTGVAASAAVTNEVQSAILDAVADCLSFDNLVVWRAFDESGISLIGLEPSSAEAVRLVNSCQASASRGVLEPLVAPSALMYLTDTSVATESGTWLERAGGTRIVVALLVVLVITLAITLSAARRLLRPIRSMTRATQRIAAGDRGARVRVRGSDELARLGEAFNTMADSIHESERQRRQLVSDVAHELRNPLANVRGYLEGVQDDIVRADGVWVESLLEETMILQRLIDDLQDLALADSGRLRIHPEPTDAATLAGLVVAAHQPQAATAGVTVTVDAPSAAPLVADPVRVRQMIGNLLSNALHYTPPNGEIVVAVRAGGPPRDGAVAVAELVEISVADTGIGIEAEHLARLFDRFYRADSSRSRETGGSGLGLAIVRHIAEAHGGAVHVTSAVGRGSTFSITLPTRARPPAPRGDARQPVSARRLP